MSPNSSLEPFPQRLGGVDVGAGGHGAADRAQRPVAVHRRVALRAVAAHSSVSRSTTATSGSARDHRAVERADAGAEHEVRDDAALEEGAQHADLDGAEHAAAAEHEGGGQVTE